MHRNTSHDSLMSALSIDNSSENKKGKKKKKKKDKDSSKKEKKLKKIRSDGSVRSSKGKKKKSSKSKNNEEWVPQGPPVDMLTANRRYPSAGVSTLATDGYTQELVQHKAHHHQANGHGNGALVPAVKRKSKTFQKQEQPPTNGGALVPMGAQQQNASFNQVQTARQKFDARLAWTFEGAPAKHYEFEQVVHGHFPGAVTNQELVTSVVSTLFNKGYKVGNTLLVRTNDECVVS